MTSRLIWSRRWQGFDGGWAEWLGMVLTSSAASPPRITRLRSKHGNQTFNHRYSIGFYDSNLHGKLSELICFGAHPYMKSSTIFKAIIAIIFSAGIWYLTADWYLHELKRDFRTCVFDGSDRRTAVDLLKEWELEQLRNNCAAKFGFSKQFFLLVPSDELPFIKQALLWPVLTDKFINFGY
jgi:hypothetical protein